MSTAPTPSPPDKRVLFLDTNSLLHYPPIKNVDWRKACGGNDVRLMFCLQVIHELDEKKDDSRLGDRARRTIKEIKELLAAGGLVQPAVTIEVFNREVRAADFPGTLSFDSKDDRIVQAVRLFLEEEPTAKVAVYSEDMGMSLRCQAHRISVVEPDASTRLENPVAEHEKKYRLAVTELNELKNRAPIVELVFTDDAAKSPVKAPLICEVAGVWTERDIAIELEEYTSSNKLVPLERKELSGPVQAIFPAGNDAVTRYNSDLAKHLKEYAKWLETRELLEKVNAHLFRFSVWLTNTGLAPADDLDLVLDFPDVLVSLFGEHDDAANELELDPPPKPPERPKQRFTDIGSLHLGLNYPEVVMPDIDHMFENRPSVERTEDGKSFRVRYSVNRLKHHEHEHCGILLATIRPDAIRPFQIQFRITAANLPKPMTGTVPIVVKRRGAATS